MQSDSDISAVVMAALSEEEGKKVSITTMLEAVARQFDAFGCGLWELSPFERNPDGSECEPTKVITVAAWWQGGKQFAMDDVPVDGSPTGQAVLNGTATRVIDIQSDEGGPKGKDLFWKENDVRAMCVVPLIFLDGSSGAINIYRTGYDRPFTIEEQEQLEAVARLIPGLYRGIREKIELNLVKKIGTLLITKHDRTGKDFKRGKALRHTEMTRLLKEVCHEVARAFSCVEVSIFLEVRHQPAHYELAATSDLRCVKEKSYRMFGGTPSLTEHVINLWGPLIIPDLTKIYDYTGWLAGMEYTPRAPLEHYTNHARKVLHLKKRDRLPPMSFLAMPIFGEGEWQFSNDFCGVIRCYGAKEGPYYFEDRDAETLQVVAALVGRWWAAWRTRTELEQENENWERLGRQLDVMNTLALGTLKENRDCRQTLLKEGLRLAEAVLPGAQLNDYRLHDPESDSLSFDMFSEKAQAHLRIKEKHRTDLAVFAAQDKKMWGPQVFRNGKAMVKFDLRADKDYIPIFADATAIIIAPVGVGETRFGVLDLRWTGTQIPGNALQAATLIGQQIGVWLQMDQLFMELRARRKDAEEADIIQKRIYEDFSHQLKSPLQLAKLRVEEAVRSYPPMHAPHALMVARGLVRRVHRVAASMRMLSEISKGQPFKLNIQPVAKEWLLKMLIELGIDAGHQYQNSLKFWVDAESFDHIRYRRYSFDYETVEQALGNILDNAGKYGKPGSTVIIRGGVSATERFYISVENEGIPISNADLAHIGKRGYRTRAAKGLGLDGQGIGLWLVREMLAPQKGELQLIYRPNDRRTEFRIAFQPAPPGTLSK